jgi:extracellular factor (EF) 3-hydroxypalmitic acid methyl ester biosynthesis protein
MTEGYFELIDRMVAQGGPRVEDYAALDCWMSRLDRAVTNGKIPRDALAVIRGRFGDAFSEATLQGLALAKPHGYAGDFEIIDRIYQKFTSSIPHLRSWDTFWQSHAAPVAVRNRKAYFHRLLDALSTHGKPVCVLNVASGPARCIFEWLAAHPKADVIFDCVEIDSKAIDFATQLNHTFCKRVRFIHKNAVRFRPTRQYDLIWSAGLFDYFDDRLFRVALRRLLPAIAPDGELVIGNFSHSNPSRAWMAFSEWSLHLRTGDQLIALAEDCDVIRSRLSVNQEPTGVNLFLHITSDCGRVTQRCDKAKHWPLCA